MIILGIDESHNAGAAIVKDDKIVSVINEERLNGIKNYWGFPYLSINAVIKDAGIAPSDIDKVAISNLSALGESDGQNPKARMDNIYKKGNMHIARKAMYTLSNFKFVESMLFAKLALLYGRVSSFKKRKKGKKYLRSIGINAPVELIEHHHAHACAAYLTSPYKKSLTYTCDFMGDFICCSVYKCDENGMKRIKEMPFYSAPGMIYTWITYFLGFMPGKHEGKITGLAAYGDPEKTYRKFAKYTKLSKDKSRLRRDVRGFWYLNAIKKFEKDFKGVSREDIAAGLQKRFEDVLSENINYYVKKTGLENISVAGGVFANVKLNQKIKDLPGVKDIFIHPAMDDGGLALGAALATWANNRLSSGQKLKSFDINHVFFGPEYTSDEIEAELKKHNIKYKYCKEIEKEVAKLLHKNKVVARFNGRMEYGPRALGNRSILYAPVDRSVNDWLNKRLNRTEFMPFAPVTLKEYAKESYKDFKGAERAAKFMTIAFNVSKKFAKECPAVTHIDNTARPQIIHKEDNPSYYKIIDEYRKLSKIATLVNTSFNMHEWPIVCSPKDAIKSFQGGKLDYLAMGNFLLKN
jgi:carbamoyltransferase